MYKQFLIIAGLFLMGFMGALAQNNFHDFEVQSLDGSTFDMSFVEGKKVLVVNTASKCGYTPQYETLQEIYEKYGDQDFVVIGFPANNFKNQEPGSAEEIREFCSVNYGVTFPMMAKISVKGEDKHPVYQWLTEKDKNGVKDSEVAWNFQKYLINPDGSLHAVYPPKTKPDDPEIVQWITSN